MSKFRLFAERATSGDSRGAIEIWRASSAEILTEYRRMRDDEEGDEWYSGEYALFDKLIYSGVNENDPQAIQSLRSLLEAGVMINEEDRDGYTPVGLLAMIGNLDLLKLAVSKGADVNSGQTNALGMIFGTSKFVRNWREVADYLLEAGLSVNGRSDQQPALFGAVRRNHRDAIEYLVRKGADINQVYELRHKVHCGTAMHYSLVTARTNGTDIETARLLVHHGGDPTVKNQEGLGAIDAFFAADLEPTGDVQKIVELYASREDWRQSSRYLSSSSLSDFKNTLKQDREFNCPNCAETIKFEAKTCRFCGQILNSAVKKGFPEFYSRGQHDLGMEALKYDYLDHVLADYGGSLTAPNVFGNLMNYGELDEYEQYSVVRDAMRRREAELAGGDLEANPGFPDQTRHYWQDAKPEQRALYILRRYIELARDYTKRFGGEDKRQNVENLEFTIAELRALIDLVESAPEEMEGYAELILASVEACAQQLQLARHGGSLNDGRTASEKIQDALRKTQASPDSRELENRGSAFLKWSGVAILILIVIVVFF